MDAQGTNPLAKADTVLLLLAAEADPWVDLSQYAVDLIEDTAYYEDPSALRALAGATGRELYVQATIETTDASGMLLYHGSEADPSVNTYAIFLNASGEIEFRQAAAILVTVVLNLGDDSLVSAHWSSRPNPDTTGAGDALISEFIVYNHTSAAYVGEIIQVTHAVPATDAGWTLAVGGFWNGAAFLLAETTHAKCRIGKAWHTAAEFAEDWVADRTAHGSTLEQLLDPLPLTFASGIGDETEWCGQANVGYAAAAADQNRGRMLTNLISERYSDARTLTSTPSPTQWLAGPPGGSTVYRLDVTKLRWLPHPGPAMAWVRVQVQSWVTAGAAVPIGIRVYAFNRPHLGVGPTLEGFPTPALDYDFVESTLTADHGSSGVGVWLELGLLRVPRFTGSAPSWAGTTTLGLAHAFDPAAASANDANARLRIKAWHVRPIIGLG